MDDAVVVRRFEGLGDLTGDWPSASADDQRFLMLQKAETNPSSQLNLVQNWFEDLKTRVPRK